MSYDPYRSPMHYSTPYGGHNQSNREAVLARVGPAGMGLLVIGIIGVSLYSLSLIANILFLVTGAADVLQDDGLEMSAESQILFRAFWGIVMLGANIVTLMAGINMRRLTNLGLCRTGAIFAVIPCLSLCCIVGIPFGIWALVALSGPDVADAFS